MNAWKSVLPTSTGKLTSESHDPSILRHNLVGGRSREGFKLSNRSYEANIDITVSCLFV